MAHINKLIESAPNALTDGAAVVRAKAIAKHMKSRVIVTLEQLRRDVSHGMLMEVRRQVSNRQSLTAPFAASRRAWVGRGGVRRSMLRRFVHSSFGGRVRQLPGSFPRGVGGNTGADARGGEGSGNCLFAHWRVKSSCCSADSGRGGCK